MMNWETNLTTTIATISVKNSQRTTKPIDHFKTRTFVGCVTKELTWPFPIHHQERLQDQSGALFATPPPEALCGH